MAKTAPLLFGDFGNDDLAETITGLDNNGDPGSASLFPGLFNNDT